MRRHEVTLYLQGLNDARQPLVEMLNACDVMQDALVYPERAVRQRISRPYFNQSPPAQGRSGRQRAPVRVGQRGKRQAESRIGRRLIAVGGGAKRCETRIELPCGAEQQHASLERREAKPLAKRFERGRRGHGRSRFP